MGHIELAVPVQHIGSSSALPSRIGLALDMTARHLERVIYYEDYLVIDPGTTPLKPHSCSRKSNSAKPAKRTAPRRSPPRWAPKPCAKALERVDLTKQADELAIAMTETKSKQIRKKLAKRIKLLQACTPRRAVRNG